MDVRSLACLTDERREPQPAGKEHLSLRTHGPGSRVTVTTCKRWVLLGGQGSSLEEEYLDNRERKELQKKGRRIGSWFRRGNKGPDGQSSTPKVMCSVRSRILPQICWAPRVGPAETQRRLRMWENSSPGQLPTQPGRNAVGVVETATKSQGHAANNGARK
ncbi:uncharacterized protein LOC117067205 isoform X6 [Trachypithecus francoisi]|uniref:uncharacterized protein LOC117067205 isoform X6 n=1 Tax=Trachypithecus francoisi TaxID=54180 RepID=UPI00141BCB76|nr:uncharacterized protein LOC117067205 isoform X6 [Trachypithecus francoisi]